jgi:hypothetical protein
VTPGEEIDAYIASLTDWRGAMLARFREIFHEAAPEVVEEWKWRGSPVWEHDGIIAVGMAFTTNVKLGFLCGASLPDPQAIFNNELAGNQRRAIKLGEGDTVDEDALKAIIRAAVLHNTSKRATPST